MLQWIKLLCAIDRCQNHSRTSCVSQCQHQTSLTVRFCGLQPVTYGSQIEMFAFSAMTPFDERRFHIKPKLRLTFKGEKRSLKLKAMYSRRLTVLLEDNSFSLILHIKVTVYIIINFYLLGIKRGNQFQNNVLRLINEKWKALHLIRFFWAHTKHTLLGFIKKCTSRIPSDTRSIMLYNNSQTNIIYLTLYSDQMSHVWSPCETANTQFNSVSLRWVVTLFGDCKMNKW